MSFINPILALVGVLAVTIPIVIHLLRRKRKPVAWGAMRFLVEAYRRRRRRLTVEQWLLLASRCILVAAVGLALGRPLFGAAAGLGSDRPTTLYVLLDNSLTSGFDPSGERAILEDHRERAATLIEGLDATRGDRAGLVLLGGPAEPVVVPASSDLGALARLAREAPATDSAADFAGAIDAIAGETTTEQGSEDAPRMIVAVVSEFRSGSADPARPLPALRREEGPPVSVVALAPAQAGASGESEVNVSITALEPRRSVVVAGDDAGSGQARVLLRRSSPAGLPAATTRVTLAVEASASETARPVTLAERDIRWEAGVSEAETLIAFRLDASDARPETANTNRPGTGDASPVLVATIDRDAIDADNTRRAPVRVRDALRIGIIAPPRFGTGPGLDAFSSADWFRLALAPIPGGPLSVRDLDPASLSAPELLSLDAVLLTRPDEVPDADWQTLRSFTDAGGLLVIAPPPDETVHLWTDRMVETLGVPWSVSREATAVAGGLALDPAPAEGSLLGLIAGELEELVNPVRVFRRLTLDERTSAGERVLTFRDGTTFAIASPPGRLGAQPVTASSATSPSGSSEELGSETDGRQAQAPSAPRGLVVLLTAPPHLGWTDLPAKPLMIPLAQELVRQGVGSAAGTETLVAGGVLPSPAGPAGEGGIPARRAGVVRLDAGNATRAIAINPDANAGLVETSPPDAVRAWLAASADLTPDRVRFIDAESASDDGDGAGGAIDAAAADSPLVLPLLLIAALAMLAELVLARRQSSLGTSDAGGIAA